MSSPLNTMRPLSGRRILVMRRSSVVLPAPLGPMRPTISSRASAKLMLLTAVRPPKRLVNSSTAKNGVDMSLEYLVDEKSLDQTSVELTGWANPLARLREALEKDEFALYCQPVRRAGGRRALSHGRGAGAHARGGARAAAAGRIPAGVRALRHDADA